MGGRAPRRVTLKHAEDVDGGDFSAPGRHPRQRDHGGTRWGWAAGRCRLGSEHGHVAAKDCVVLSAVAALILRHRGATPTLIAIGHSREISAPGCVAEHGGNNRRLARPSSSPAHAAATTIEGRPQLNGGGEESGGAGARGAHISRGPRDGARCEEGTEMSPGARWSWQHALRQGWWGGGGGTAQSR